MGASSVTGVGPGGVRDLSAHQLTNFFNGPTIIFAGVVDADDGPTSSPPGYNNLVTLPYPLPGSPDDYLVILTGINTGNTYCSGKNENVDGNFWSFGIVVESGGLVQYLVVNAGLKTTAVLA